MRKNISFSICFFKCPLFIAFALILLSVTHEVLAASEEVEFYIDRVLPRVFPAEVLEEESSELSAVSVWRSGAECTLEAFETAGLLTPEILDPILTQVSGENAEYFGKPMVVSGYFHNLYMCYLALKNSIIPLPQDGYPPRTPTEVERSRLKAFVQSFSEARIWLYDTPYERLCMEEDQQVYFRISETEAIRFTQSEWPQ